MGYFYEEIPMETIRMAEQCIETALKKEELRLACECATQCTAYATFTSKRTGSKVYVARKTDWDSKSNSYRYTVQVLDEDLEVKGHNVYTEHTEYPLMMMAVKVIRMTR